MYHLTNTQMGLLGSAYGVLGVFSYIIGGVLADKIKAKKLLIFSNDCKLVWVDCFICLLIILCIGSDLWIMGCYISFDFLACAYEDCQNPGN